jgi:hypothetical protein
MPNNNRNTARRSQSLSGEVQECNVHAVSRIILH